MRFIIYILEDTLWLVCEYKTVWIVIDQQNAVFFSPSNKLGQKLGVNCCSSWHMWTIDPHQSNLCTVNAFKLLKVWLPMVIFLEIVKYCFSFYQSRDRGIGWVARIGHQYLVTRVEECHRNVHNPFFGSQQG